VTGRQIDAILVHHARRGRRVVRLKGGDPFVVGRGREEAEALAVAAVVFEIVPGVSPALAAPACAGIPVTHRGVASSFTVVSPPAVVVIGDVVLLRDPIQWFSEVEDVGTRVIAHA
jgi:siroheme synthase